MTRFAVGFTEIFSIDIGKCWVVLRGADFEFGVVCIDASSA